MVIFLGAGLVVAASVYGIVTLVRVTKQFKKTMDDTIETFRLERQLLALQRQLVEQINTQTLIQRQIIEARIAMAMNTITAARLVLEKQNDPEWMQRFDGGRNNAQFN